MKKIYEAPKMLLEVICVEEPLAASITINSDSIDKVGSDNADDVLLGKDRGDSDWGGLW